MKGALRLSVFVGLLCLTVAPAIADIDVGLARITRVDGFFGGGGGEFTLGNNALLSTAEYSDSPMTRGVGTFSNSFQSFCMEFDEDLTLPQDLYVRISTTAIDQATGAITGPGSHAVNGGETYGDNLDARTAYLYTKFAQGELAGYDYSASGREASALQLQRAIWYIEDESGGSFNSFVQLANNAVAQGGEWEGRGIGRVRVLNLYDDANYTTHLQDQIYLSVPAPGAAMLGTFGLVGLVALRRRIA